MKCMVYSTQAFFHKQCMRLLKIDMHCLKEKNLLFSAMLQKHPKQVWRHSTDTSEEIRILCEELLKLSPSLSIAIFRNNPNVIEGLELLQKGIKAYAHSFSNPKILEQIFETLHAGNLWIYPELMQFMIASTHATLSQPSPSLSLLTPKEKEIALLISEGYTNAKIASILNIAEITVKKHVSTLFEKLAVKDRLSLALKIKHS